MKIHDFEYSIGLRTDTALFSPLTVSGSDDEQGCHLENDNYKVPIINAKYMGNFGSFFQHLLDLKDLPRHLNSHNGMGLDIATANVIGDYVYYNNYPHYAFRAIQDIPKGSILRYSYLGNDGDRYWQNKKALAKEEILKQEYNK